LGDAVHQLGREVEAGEGGTVGGHVATAHGPGRFGRRRLGGGDHVGRCRRRGRCAPFRPAFVLPLAPRAIARTAGMARRLLLARLGCRLRRAIGAVLRTCAAPAATAATTTPAAATLCLGRGFAGGTGRWCCRPGGPGGRGGRGGCSGRRLAGRPPENHVPELSDHLTSINRPLSRAPWRALAKRVRTGYKSSQHMGANPAPWNQSSNT